MYYNSAYDGRTRWVRARASEVTVTRRARSSGQSRPITGKRGAERIARWERGGACASNIVIRRAGVPSGCRKSGNAVRWYTHTHTIGSLHEYKWPSRGCSSSRLHHHSTSSYTAAAAAAPPLRSLSLSLSGMPHLARVQSRVRSEKPVSSTPARSYRVHTHAHVNGQRRNQFSSTRAHTHTHSATGESSWSGGSTGDGCGNDDAPRSARACVKRRRRPARPSSVAPCHRQITRLVC